MQDIHTHILHGVDHGSSDIETSLDMLAKVEAEGIDAVALTSHFYMKDESIEQFLDRYMPRYDELKQAYHGDVKLYRGAEIAIDKDVSIKFKLRDLALGDSKYILIELPFGNKVTRDDVIDSLLEVEDYTGLTPIVAHVEEYPYLRKDYRFMENILNIDALLHVDATSIVDTTSRKYALDLIKRGYIHTISSDYHYDRPMCLKEAYDIVEQRFDKIVRGALELGSEIF